MRLGSIRSTLVLIVGIVPPSTMKNAVLRRLGWKIGKGTEIGSSIFHRIDSVDLGEDARIGSGNVVRSISTLRLGSSSRIGQWNWISAAAPLRQAGAPAALEIGAHSAVTSRHYMDASGGIIIGSHTTVAGVRSTFITHGIDWRSSSQTYRGIRIGDYCLVSSNVNVTPGATVDSRAVVGMGATISGHIEGGSLSISGRARSVRTGLEGQYFSRKKGFISRVRET